MLRGSLRLETGRVLTFEIHDGAVGAFFEDEPAELFDRREASPADGLSSVSARPAGRPDFRRRRGAARRGGDRARRDDDQRGERLARGQRRRGGAAADLPRRQRLAGVRRGRMVGVVSEADLIGKSGATVGEVMTSPAVTIAESTSLEQRRRTVDPAAHPAPTGRGRRRQSGGHRQPPRRAALGEPASVP